MSTLIWRLRWRERREKLAMTIAWRLPRWLVYWAYIRVHAHATTGPWGDCHPDDVSWHVALKRWSAQP